MDLFATPVVQYSAPPLEQLIDQSVASIKRAFHSHPTMRIAFSSGKDSTALMILAFMAALEAKAEGVNPTIFVCHSDTLIENPVIHQLARSELAKIEAYAKAHDIRLEVHIAYPELLDAWGPRICGGRALPSYSTLNTDCSTEWKVQPIRKLFMSLAARLEAGQEAVTLTGTRRAESIARATKMLKRGDSALTPVRNKLGDLVLSPIADWDTDSVFELAGMCSAGIIASYTDAKEVLVAYRDGGPTSCAVVNDSITEGQVKKGGCSARFGCALCVAVQNDKSMDHMLEKDPQYEFMRGLGRLRNYLMAIQNDMGRRLWVGRTIRCNHIAIRPDVFSPEELRRIFRMAVTLDVLEAERASSEGIEPRFRLIPPEAAIAVDALWSLNVRASSRDVIYDCKRERNNGGNPFFLRRFVDIVLVHTYNMLQ